MKTTWIVGLLSASAILGCGHATHQHLGVHAEGAAQADDDDGLDDEDDDGEDGDEQERAVALADVPRAVLDAANAVVPGATWTSAIVVLEGGGPKRFVDLQERLKLSPNTLSERLRELGGAGLLTRTAYPEIPPRVDYEATPKARDLRDAWDQAQPFFQQAWEKVT